MSELKDQCCEIVLSTGVTLRSIPSIGTLDYMAGDDGKIYSKKHRNVCEAIGTDGWRPLSGKYTFRGYLEVVLSVKGKPLNSRVHRLVCEAFHGPQPFSRAFCLHEDGTRANNIPSNLRWGSAMDNAADRERHGRTISGGRVPSSVLSEKDVALIKMLLKERGSKHKAIAELFGVSLSSVARIDRKESWLKQSVVASVVYSDNSLPEYELEGA